MKSIKVLIVEDDESIALYLKNLLENEGYLVTAIAKDMAILKSEIKLSSPDIVVIDISLQKSRNSIKLASYIREKELMPFIFLVANDDNRVVKDASKTEPYGYVIKPVDPINIKIVIQMALHKYDQEKKHKERHITLKTHRLNLEKMLDKRKLSNTPTKSFAESNNFNFRFINTFYNNQEIKLSVKENSLIYLLVAQIGCVITFEQIITYIWGKSSMNNVRTLVWRLRNKLPTDIIKSSSGHGYFVENHTHLKS